MLVNIGSRGQLSMESLNLSHFSQQSSERRGQGEPPEQLSIAELARCCAEETTKFLKQSTSNDRFCLELFRRAIIRRDDAAWQSIYQQYAPLVLTWVTQHQSVTQLLGQ